jgi:hypothetical protein
MKGACLCGRVTVHVAGRPDQLNACNCAMCWKLGTLWAYYDPLDVTVAGALQSYRREDMAETHITAENCPTCGTTTCWSPLDPASDRMGVNMRLFDPDALAGVEVRYEDGRGGSSEACPRFYREPTVLEEMRA